MYCEQPVSVVYSRFGSGSLRFVWRTEVGSCFGGGELCVSRQGTLCARAWGPVWRDRPRGSHVRGGTDRTPAGATLTGGISQKCVTDLVKDILLEFPLAHSVRFQKVALVELRKAAELFMTGRFEEANILASHRGSQTVSRQDFSTMRRLGLL